MCHSLGFYASVTGTLKSYSLSTRQQQVSQPLVQPHLAAGSLAVVFCMHIILWVSRIITFEPLNEEYQIGSCIGCDIMTATISR